MLHVFLVSTTAAAVMLLAAPTAVGGTPLHVRNNCDFTLELYDNTRSEQVAPGASTTRDLPTDFHGMFRHGTDPQATLAEFSISGGKLWYDVSIIPTGPKGGPGDCSSLDECKRVTGGVGFNVPLQIAPRTCKKLTCLQDGCSDAYQFPRDNAKTTACSDPNTVIDLTFCPNGV